MLRILMLLMGWASLAGCGTSIGEPKTESQNWQPLRDSVRIPDPLNEQYFKVQVDSTGKTGTYKITAAYGFNEGSALMVLPRGAESFKPAMRRADSYMTFIIGFSPPHADAAVFYDYYQVRALQKTVEMNYIKAYRFE